MVYFKTDKFNTSHIFRIQLLEAKKNFTSNKLKASVIYYFADDTFSSSWSR